ncbi:STAS domain-containing protein [Actinoplanes sp. CA-142083]|uniref:STAS domain-containing protein n=1 Tax=Actinoplanes sp. CA-142083 TaxID=3239903 RepID=UPI003D8FB793
MSRFADDSVHSAVQWSRRHVDGAEVIFVSGELDLVAAAELRSHLMTVAESTAAPLIVLDFSGVTFIDAKCAGVIMGAWEAAAGRGRRLRVDGLRGLPKTVFDLLGLTPMLTAREAASVGGRDRDDREQRLA